VTEDFHLWRAKGVHRIVVWIHLDAALEGPIFKQPKVLDKEDTTLFTRFYEGAHEWPTLISVCKARVERIDSLQIL
jgi:hypothetical protein